MQLCELKRNFLNQLAYVCDYIKGGDTVTAIALEAQPPLVTFWMPLLDQDLDFPFQIRAKKRYQTRLVAHRRSKRTTAKIRSQMVVCC